ncbi:nuclear transport factor 2 family protein [Rosenbergiella collisarenosi]|uniref:nuclear transport factor 2 family protein n=1 Tax=Rosenbergiella collisarenosi TaxID=1544695 RepID=UPI003BADA2F4
MRNSKALAVGVGLLMASTSLLAEPANSVPNSQSEANRQLVVTFYNQFFNQHDIDAASKVVADGYRQHNPQVPDGKQPFVSYFKGYFKQHPQSHAQIIRSAVDGDLVWLHIHSTESPKDRGQAIVDIFRVDHGKIVEHWDVIQDVPQQAANSNTMF